MPPAYRQNVRMVVDGEPVAAATVDRPLGDLAGNDAYLLDRLDAATLGSALYLYGAAAAAGVQVGQPVYWDAANGRFDRALAAITIDPATSAAAPAATADVVGVCTATYPAGTIDVCTSGVAAIDLTLSAGAGAAAGRYYLSTATAGGLVAQSPAISVPVLYAFGNGTVCVQPQIRELFTDHVHYVFNLFCQPAGTTSPPAAGQRHVISADNPALPGWLNASNAVFNGLAPAGAVFGYNLAQHPALQAVWPPLPAGGAVLFWNKGLDETGGTLVPLGLDGGLAVIDQNGIWWLSNCYQMVPWPYNYDSASPPAPPGPPTTPPTCPPPVYTSLVLGYYVSLFASRTALVTQLRATPGSAITVTDWAGNPATAGQLEVGIDWTAMTEAGDVNGSEVLKTFTGGNFTKGFVTEGVQVTGGGLSATATTTLSGTTATATAVLSGTSVVALIPGLAGYGYATAPAVTFSGGGGSGAAAHATIANGAVTGYVMDAGGTGYTAAPTVQVAAPPPTYQGVVSLQLTAGAAEIEVRPDLVKLVDAVERSFTLPPYVGLPADRASAVVLKYEVPPAGLPAGPVAAVQLTFYGPATGGTGTLPPLTATYLRVTGSAGTVPIAPVPLALTTGQSLGANAFLQATTASFPVAAGDTVYVTLNRAGNDGYSPEVALLRSGLVISAG